MRALMQSDTLAIDTFWQAYLAQLPPTHPHRLIKPDAFAFGGEGPLGDELAALVLDGKKRATTSLPIEFTSLGEALPQIGDVSIVLDGQRKPVAIIERTDVQSIPFELVDAHFAMIEGEGDGSLAYWREAHTEYFLGVCNALGGTFCPSTPVLCQQFRVLWQSDD
jgi:uncharacterized protein YhfF